MRLNHKLNIMIFALIALTLGVSYFSYVSLKKLLVNHRNMELIIETRNIASEISDQKISEDYLKSIQDIRKEIEPENQRELFSDIIQAYTANNKPLLRKRTKQYLQSEEIYYKNLKAETQFVKDKFFFYGSIAIASILSLIFLIRHFFFSEIFNPLKNTKQRMTDFLNGKYSYEFRVPKDNEMGELQATFNSMAQAVLKNMEELKALDSAKSDFLNIASHELRTPMTSIKGSLGLISSGVMGKSEPEILNLIKIAENETDRLIRLINDVLDIAKIDARKLPLKLEWVLASDIIDKTMLSLQGLATSFGVQILKKPFQNIKIFCDADRIQQVLTNLVSNALKFSPPNDIVEISVQPSENGFLSIAVQDHGKGMTPKEKTILFQKFRQISSPENPLVKGTGLGLAIAKALVEEHDGSIDVISSPNEGSTFYFTLPQWEYIGELAKDESAA